MSIVELAASISLKRREFWWIRIPQYQFDKDHSPKLLLSLCKVSSFLSYSNKSSFCWINGQKGNQVVVIDDYI